MNRGFYLTLQMGAVRPRPVSATVTEALTEVQVTSASSSQSGFQLTFTLGKNSDLVRNLLPSGFFDPRTRVIISVTVNGTVHVLMDGIITKQDVTPSNQAGQSTLTLTGLDLSVLMDFVDLSDIPYPATPPEGRIALILAKYAVFGVIPAIIPSPISLFNNFLVKVDKQKGTDLQYINQLAQAVGHIFYIDPGPVPGASVAYWGPEIRRGNPQPALSVNMDAASNVESLSFSYDGLKRQQFLMTILEERTGFPIPIPIPQVNLLKPTLAANDAVSLKLRRVSASHLAPLDAAALGLALASETADAVTASGQLDVSRYGSVLAARKLVAVRGGGRQFDGLYFVNSVTHNVARGRYTQSFTLVRGGVGTSIERVSA